MPKDQQGRYPFAGLVDTVSDLTRMRETMHGGQGSSQHAAQSRTHVDAWTPAVDIAATDQQLVIRAELAAVAEDDLDITFSPPTLTIAGERSMPSTRDGDGEELVHHTRELNRGRFRRSITLPEGINRDDIVVELRHGLLTITAHRPNRPNNTSPLSVTHHE